MISAPNYWSVISSLESAFSNRYEEKPIGHIRLVGILFAPIGAPLAQAEIIPRLSDFHHRTGNNIDFFWQDTVLLALHLHTFQYLMLHLRDGAIVRRRSMPSAIILKITPSGLTKAVASCCLQTQSIKKRKNKFRSILKLQSCAILKK